MTAAGYDARYETPRGDWIGATEQVPIGRLPTRLIFGGARSCASVEVGCA